MKKRIRIILFVILLAIAALIGLAAARLAGIPGIYKGLDTAEKYRNMDSVDYVHFTENDFGDYEDIRFQVRDVRGLFRSTGAMYTVRYSEAQYEEQLTVIDALDYLNEKENKDENGGFYMPAVQVEKNGWTIRVLDNNNHEYYPKQFGMIGTNDESHTIVYMFFTDMDLDFISEEPGEQEMEGFIEKYFHFNFD